MTIDGIRVEREGDIVTVTFDRPERRNAIDYVQWQGIATLFNELADDHSVRGVILTGAGGCFSAGADISDFETTRATPEQGIAYEVAVDAACDAIAALGRPVIAAIDGYCYGGACNIAMACDFRFLSPAARMAIPAGNLSIVYGVRGTMRLLALVGLTEAKRIFYSARPFDASHALRTGFADAVEADPVAAARAWLENVKDVAPLSIQGAKAILNMASMPDTSFNGHAADEAIFRALTSDDYKEGRAAFAEKRRPRFTGD